jgi:protocatechuate 3,4-dioxygenase beta subunit
MKQSPNRRQFLGASAALVFGLVSEAHAQGGRARPTPACGDDGVTPAQTPGPYFKPQSPLRTSLLEPGMPGPKIVVEGTVLTTDCKPVPRALLDFWQADARGDYDNNGYRLRGHQFTDDAGRYRLETVVPGNYPGRTRHFHVKVQAPGRRVLTTQLYFPDEPQNQRDGIFDRDLVIKVRDAEGGKDAAANGKVARFVFVL